MRLNTLNKETECTLDIVYGILWNMIDDVNVECSGT